MISPIVSAIQALSAQIASLEDTIAGFATIFHTNELCVGSTCVTPAQFQAMVAAAGQTASPREESTDATTTGSNPTDTPPEIEINGDNPAIVQAGDTYNDLGATIEGPQQDLNLGIQTFVNGAPMSPVQIDTSQIATDTVDYVAIDQNGLTPTTIRTGIIEALSARCPTVHQLGPQQESRCVADARTALSSAHAPSPDRGAINVTR